MELVDRELLIKSFSKRPTHHNNLNSRRNRDRLKPYPYAYSYGHHHVPESHTVNNIQPSRFHYYYPYSHTNEYISYTNDPHIVHYFSHPRFRPQIRIIERPSFIERRSDARGKLVSQIVNRASQAFQNLIEHRRNRSRPRLTKFMSERRSSAGRLFPRVRERFVHRIESRKPKPPEPIVDNEQQQDIQFAESRIDGNETAIGAINNQLPPPPPPSQELNDERQFYKQPNLNYELEGQKLRQDIVDKVGHLQTILETAFQVSRERRDLFLSRLLRNTNNRLERAKNRADQILSEPATSELAVKTLHHINNGINNMNLFLHNLLNRINVSINVQMKNPETESSMPNINNNNNNNNNNSSINNGTTSQTKNNDKDQQS
ncbi:hypothetical protein DERF_007097 [Dermatophagoides farinae]|uniref:Uncharacterized protein n=1 Tax=Dermatophagoides farinae TaxID=6954 RepID=A0A922I2R0_DERFA|nr:hypothetical protein DERF_007097 [Dermatophagoides farinae]